MTEPTIEIVSDTTDTVGRRQVIENRGPYSFVDEHGDTIDMPAVVIYRVEERAHGRVYSQHVEAPADSLVHDEPYVGVMWEMMFRDLNRRIVDGDGPTPNCLDVGAVHIMRTRGGPCQICGHLLPSQGDDA